jgi:O-antigen/teichoic acid export membrane protein
MRERMQVIVVRWLRWSEKYTKTDMVYLMRGSSLSFVGQGVGLVASLALAVVISRYVPKDVYGTYKFILSIVSILSLFSLTGIGGAVFQSAARGLDGALRRGFWENIKWSAAIFIGGLVVAIYYFWNNNGTLGIGVLIGASLAPFITSASLFGPFLGGKKDFWRQTIYGIIDNVVPVAIFIGVVLFTANPVVLVLTYFATNALAALFFYRRTLIVYHASLHQHDDDLVNYSKHLSVMGIIGGVADNLDQILLFHFVGAAQLAVYNFATAIPDMLKGPAKNIDNMMQARFATRKAADIRESIGNKVLWYSVGVVLTVVLYIVLVPVLFRIFFPQYMSAVWYSQLYVLWLISLSMDPFGTYIWAKKLTREMYTSSLIYSIWQIGSILVGLFLWGITGVILARISARFVINITNYFLYRKAIAREIAATSN